MLYLACSADSVGAIAEQSRAPLTTPQLGRPMSQSGDIATIYIHGAMSRAGDFSGGTSTEAASKLIAEAVDNPQIKGILLVVNSPGGTTQGTSELARAVRVASERKPVVAFIQDVGASAAYWVASQASRIFCASDAVVGSIGTVAVVVDSSRAVNKSGFVVHAIRADATSEHKTVGYPGVPISEAQLAEVKKRVQFFNDLLLQAVGHGRGLSGKALERVADGRVFMAKEAMQLGLIDQVGTYDDALAYVASGRTSPKRADAISAWSRTIDGLMAVKGISKAQATRYAMEHHRELHSAYVAACNGRLVDDNQQPDGTQADVAKTWHSLLYAHRAAGLDGFQAVRQIEKDHPGLREQYVRRAAAQ